MSYDYDLVVIGVGPAGEKGAARAGYYGKRVACVEAAREPGGAAVHTGTLPSIEMVFNDPTLSEMFKYAAYDALNALARP